MASNKSGVSAVHASVEDIRTPDDTSHATKSHRVEVIGGFEADIDGLPPGYFKSRFFIGTFCAIGFGLMAGVGAFVNAPCGLAIAPR